MKYTTFYNVRDYDSFCSDTNVWEKKFQEAFRKTHPAEPIKYPAILVWEIVWLSGTANTAANFSFMYIYRDSQLVKDLFSDLNISKQEVRENKTDSKRKKI